MLTCMAVCQLFSSGVHLAARWQRLFYHSHHHVFFFFFFTHSQPCIRVPGQASLRALAGRVRHPSLMFKSQKMMWEKKSRSGGVCFLLGSVVHVLPTCSARCSEKCTGCAVCLSIMYCTSLLFVPLCTSNIHRLLLDVHACKNTFHCFRMRLPPRKTPPLHT